MSIIDRLKNVKLPEYHQKMVNRLLPAGIKLNKVRLRIEIDTTGFKLYSQVTSRGCFTSGNSSVNGVTFHVLAFWGHAFGDFSQCRTCAWGTVSGDDADGNVEGDIAKIKVAMFNFSGVVIAFDLAYPFD